MRIPSMQKAEDTGDLVYDNAQVNWSTSREVLSSLLYNSIT